MTKLPPALKELNTKFHFQLSRIGSPSSIIDDDRSVDSELSTSSMSCGTLSDEENFDEVSIASQTDEAFSSSTCQYYL